jgi:hypothetical protein
MSLLALGAVYKTARAIAQGKGVNGKKRGGGAVNFK